MQSDPVRPGSPSIERYLPDAAPEEKEAAYENLQRLARLIVRVGMRLASEKAERTQTED